MRAARRVPLVLLPLCLACAHWGTTNLGEGSLDLPPVSSTYLAPVRPPLPPATVVAATADPPPPDSTVLAVSTAHCSGDEASCLQALLGETRHLGGTGLYGIHSEYVPRQGSSLVGSIAVGPQQAEARSLGGSTVVEWRPGTGGPSSPPPFDVYLQRREPDLVLNGPRPQSIENWQLVCKLPCVADVASPASFRLVAPALGGEPPLPLDRPMPDRVRVVARQGPTSYRRVCWSLAMTLAVGGVSGGTLGYFLANPSKPAGAAELSVGLMVLPGLFYALGQLLLGPERPTELAIAPDR